MRRGGGRTARWAAARAGTGRWAGYNSGLDPAVDGNGGRTALVERLLAAGATSKQISTFQHWERRTRGNGRYLAQGGG